MLYDMRKIDATEDEIETILEGLHLIECNLRSSKLKNIDKELRDLARLQNKITSCKKIIIEEVA